MSFFFIIKIFIFTLRSLLSCFSRVTGARELDDGARRPSLPCALVVSGVGLLLCSAGATCAAMYFADALLWVAVRWRLQPVDTQQQRENLASGILDLGRI